MAGRRGTVGKLLDSIKEGLADVIGQLAPQPDAVPIPVRDDPRRR